MTIEARDVEKWLQTATLPEINDVLLRVCSGWRFFADDESEVFPDDGEDDPWTVATLETYSSHSAVVIDKNKGTTTLYPADGSAPDRRPGVTVTIAENIAEARGYRLPWRPARAA